MDVHRLAYVLPLTPLRSTSFYPTFRPSACSATSRHATLNRVSRSTISMKRICVFSDGTWHTLESPDPTNIVHLTVALKNVASDGVEQALFYDEGVGSTPSDKYTGGLMGVGIDNNIKQLYSFIAMNYNEGDEIYMFGFSRGSYTVRSLAGMMYDAGLVHREKLTFVEEAYDLYRSDYKADSPQAQDFRAKHARRAPITLLGCFDTVGALGLPENVFTKEFNERYKFHDVTINPTIQNAVHLLAIDENRVPYNYTPMYPSDPKKPEQLTQKFVTGTHSGVGGGDPDWVETSRIALHLLVDEMKQRGLGIEFDESLLPPQGDPSKPVISVKYKGADWLFNELTGIKKRDIPSVDCIHPSAIRRYQTQQAWRPPSLDHLKDNILDTILSKK